MCIIRIVFILCTQLIISLQTDITLHYPNRVNRCKEEEDDNAGFFTQFSSLFILVLYILIVLGLIKALLGLCCNRAIGLQGLHLLTNQSQIFSEEDPKQNRAFNRNTEFCLNVVFFLVLPIALIVKICSRNQNKHPRRMQAGAEPIEKKSQASLKQSTISVPGSGKKKAILDIYRDGNDSETQDTKYVLEQLHRSEQSLRSGEYATSMVSG